MGLSSKQVSNDLQPWNNHHHHPLPQSMNCTEEAAIVSTVLKEPPKQLPVKRKVVDHHHHGDGDKCPRCGSGNTKFCYYNNYNKTQPRHFCKECKRHWTKGGTLRNVPVGGGRKHKRIKISSSSSNSASAKSIGLVGVTDKKSNLTHSSSSSIVKPQQQYSLSPQFSHIFDSSTTVNDNTNDLFMGKISAASPSTDHHLQINHLLDFSGSSSTTTLPYQSFSATTTPSTLDESLSIFNSSNYNSSFQTSTYGYTSDQSTSLELEVDGTLTFGTGGGTNSMNYDQSWKSNNLQLGWDEIDKFVSSDEIDVSWDIDSEINYG